MDVYVSRTRYYMVGHTHPPDERFAMLVKPTRDPSALPSCPLYPLLSLVLFSPCSACSWCQPLATCSLVLLGGGSHLSGHPPHRGLGQHGAPCSSLSSLLCSLLCSRLSSLSSLLSSLLLSLFSTLPPPYLPHYTLQSKVQAAERVAHLRQAHSRTGQPSPSYNFTILTLLPQCYDTPKEVRCTRHHDTNNLCTALLTRYLLKQGVWRTEGA
jgi:hypothetical protein